MTSPNHVEDAVLERYARGAEAVEPALCCPVEDYEGQYLAALPKEIIEKDYGCGNPSRWAREGDVVVDLGSGAGKICYILAQKVGPMGQVIGVDFNDAMLNIARKYQNPLAEQFGYGNTRFVKAKIQDLALDLDRMAAWLAEHPVTSIADMQRYEAECDRLRSDEPMIADASVDLVVSNCVLNLVRARDKQQLFAEIFRVLKRGGRAVISDIVCDEDPTPDIIADPELWSGCISGAFREDRFLAMFEEAGFHGVEILARAGEPWRTIDGVEFRSMTVRAYKGKDGPCMDRRQAAVYKGPWKTVTDDDGHTYVRGRRMAVCEKTFALLTEPSGPYAAQMIGIEPYDTVPHERAEPMDCRRNMFRATTETKGEAYPKTDGEPDASCCDPGNGKCC
ncbi:MAG: methyltransferase domain-containing protein [Planctomycetes bacterium]|nr:methyltransferase domain-containing protein [Planctomycetota bacterium]